MQQAAPRNLGSAFVGGEDLLSGGESLPPPTHICARQPGAAPVADGGWRLEPLLQSPLLSMNGEDKLLHFSHSLSMPEAAQDPGGR